MRYTDKFIKSFIKTYLDYRKDYTGEEWRKIWVHTDKDRWNDFMLWGRLNKSKRSVLQGTANDMELEHMYCESLGLDVVFIDKNYNIHGKIPYPIVVSIEHENDIFTFKEEILRLFCVRSVLNVGITYVEPQHSENSKIIKDRKSKIINDANIIYDAMNYHTKDDDNMEYLYILGIENSEYELTWNCYSFSAASGPINGIWLEA